MRWLRRTVVLTATLSLLAALALAPGARAASGTGTIVYAGSDGIYTVAGNGGSPQRVWAAPGGKVASEPRWSPDGSQIAFIGADGNVWLMQADGSNAHPLTAQAIEPVNCGEDGCASPGTEADSPRWSPNGAAISYRLVTNLSAASLWSVSAGGGAPQQLASASNLCLFNEGWSPAGTALFSRCAGASGPSNASYAASGGAAQPFVAGSQLAFSADGSRLAFSTQAMQNGAITVSLFVANADGSGAQMVAADGQDPRWSANGLIAYRVGETDGWAIHVYDPASGKDTTLGSGVVEAWSPDGAWLLFSTTGDSGGTLWRMHADGSGRQQIGAGMAADWSPAG